MIASNGAVLYDLGARRTLDRLCLIPDVALTAVARIRAQVPDAAFAFESGTHFGYERVYRTLVPADRSGPDPAPRPRGGAGARDLRGEDARPEPVPDRRRAARRVRACVGGTLTATCSSGRGEGLVELSAAGVDKASMLARTCSRLAVPARRVAAFGDMPNDVEHAQLGGDAARRRETPTRRCSRSASRSSRPTTSPAWETIMALLRRPSR